jgi:hypothetical protein
MNIILLKNLISKILTNKADIVLFLLLFCIGIKFVYYIGSYLDIELQDETLYLRNGIFLLRQGLPSSQWAPVYSIWYFFLSIFSTDSISIYYLNLQILTIILSLLLYVFLRLNKISQLISFFIGYFFLISSGNILVHPKVTHFAIFIMLCSFILFCLTKEHLLKWSFIIVGALLSAYVRPELFISFIFIAAYFLFRIIKTRSLLKNRLGILKISLIILIIIIVLGNPLGGGGRALGAFKQHFSLNWVAWNKSSLNPWRDSDEIVRNTFGDIDNIQDALFSNADLFFKHLSTNISIILQEFTRLTSQIVFTVNSYRLEYIGLYILFFIILMSTIVNLYRSRIPVLQLLKTNLIDKTEIIIISVFYMIPIISSIIIIYPRQHYLLYLLFLVIVVFIPLIKINYNKIKWEGKLTSLILIFIAILLLVVTPSPKKFYSNYSQNNLETVRFLRSLNIQSKVNMLEDNGGYYTYLTPNYSWVRDRDMVTDFNNFLEKSEINMIILSGKLLANKKFNSDLTFKNFLVNYSDYGFTKDIIPNSGNELMIKNELIHPVSR